MNQAGYHESLWIPESQPNKNKNESKKGEIE